MGTDRSRTGRAIASGATDLLGARFSAIRQPHGAVAQLGERLNGIQEVGGSTPLSSTVLPDVTPLRLFQIRLGANALDHQQADNGTEERFGSKSANF
jgi:hypothetical protein